MAKLTEDFITLNDLYRAYRKAKAEAFHEKTHFTAIGYALFEQDIDKNLKKLLKALKSGGDWASDLRLIGDYGYVPKEVASNSSPSDPISIHFRTLNPLVDWKNAYHRNSDTKFDATFRLIIKPTVEFQVISALWIIKAGHVYEAALHPSHSFGNRLRRRRPRRHSPNANGHLNDDAPGLFVPYFSAYRSWREKGLKSMQGALDQGDRIVAVTMDIRKFYHSISAEFLLRKEYLLALNISLDTDQLTFTQFFVDAINTWYRSTPDYAVRPQGGIPVGLSASKVIANVLLAEFDRTFVMSVNPLYYGRYVDDLFLVIKSQESFTSGEEFISWLASQMPTLLKSKKEKGSSNLVLQLPYATDCDLLFAGKKQKIFLLEGPHGSDLVDHIAAQIRKQSSEYRLLPDLPNDEREMAQDALLAAADASLQADALRKTDVVSVRRWGLSLLLRDVECYEKDLKPKAWRSLRMRFYELAYRYVLTPNGYFDYAGYIQRVFGLMVACGDLKEAQRFIDRLAEVSQLIEETTTAGSTNLKQFLLCKKYYGDALYQVAVQASSTNGFRFTYKYVNLLKQLKLFNPNLRTPSNKELASALARRILLADLGRRPYRDYWFHENPKNNRPVSVPKSFFVKRHLAAIRDFQTAKVLNKPHWPALVFPTRPLALQELGLVAPDLLTNSDRLKHAIFGLRGARVHSQLPLGLYTDSENKITHFYVPDSHEHERPIIAVTSFETGNEDADAALRGRANMSLERYRKVRSLINKILKEKPRASYLTLPECSIPLRWAVTIAHALGRAGVSFLVGVEHRFSGKSVRNDALISLTTNWAGYRTNICWLQPKLEPSHEEAVLIKEIAKTTLYKPDISSDHRPVYIHGTFCFGLLLCSDLTNITNRSHFQGNVDALFVLEWNPDVKTFSFLVESAAHDVHAYIVQVNNRTYGDSRVRVPFKEEHDRDLVRVKGGISDYYVLSALDIHSLRLYQSTSRPPKKGLFKPFPIGFKMSELRKQLTQRKSASKKPTSGKRKST